MAPIIAITDLVKDFHLGEVPVHVLKGDLVRDRARASSSSIMGPSGSGKSTLMNILGCLDTPTSGSYMLDGISVGALDSDELAEIRNQQDRVRLPAVQPAGAHQRHRERRAAAALHR